MLNISVADNPLLLKYIHHVVLVAGKSVPQVAIRWLLQKNVVASVLVGASSMEQLECNMGAGTGWSLTKEEVRQKWQ